jgi:hypothetical protein
MRQSSRGLKVTSRERNQKIRATIGNLTYEQQLYLNRGNDYQVERIQIVIDGLRSKLRTVDEDSELNEDNFEDQG